MYDLEAVSTGVDDDHGHYVTLHITHGGPSNSVHLYVGNDEEARQLENLIHAMVTDVQLVDE
jgi:intergrase/recombinase